MINLGIGQSLTQDQRPIQPWRQNNEAYLCGALIAGLFAGFAHAGAPATTTRSGVDTAALDAIRLLRHA
jgi:hypothetical protein